MAKGEQDHEDSSAGVSGPRRVRPRHDRHAVPESSGRRHEARTPRCDHDSPQLLLPIAAVIYKRGGQCCCSLRLPARENSRARSQVGLSSSSAANFSRAVFPRASSLTDKRRSGSCF
ncbi:hypothetical protein MTO96_012097 [Rhipicephalus appendiculatus]